MACDAACWFAKDPNCDCVCGGKNHGNHSLIKPKLESELKEPVITKEHKSKVHSLLLADPNYRKALGIPEPQKAPETVQTPTPKMIPEQIEDTVPDGVISRGEETDYEEPEEDMEWEAVLVNGVVTIRKKKKEAPIAVA